MMLMLSAVTDLFSRSKSVLRNIVPIMKKMQQQTGVKLLWGTANLFSNPRYMNGAATNPDFTVVANAAVQLEECNPCNN